MHDALNFLRRGAIVLSATALLAACGGGESPGGDTTARFVGQIAQADASAARKQALAASSPVDANRVLDWAEYKYPSLFARGPSSAEVDFQGQHYTARAYPYAGGTRYLGITPTGAIYGMGDFTGNVPQGFGVIADYAAQVTADNCNVYPGTCAAPAVGLPAELLTRRAHPDCAALRSGPYRWLNPTDSDPNWNTSLSQLDAPTGRITWADGSSSTATSTGGCSFSAEGGSTRMVVSPAGIVVMTSRNVELGRQVLAIGFPEQTANLADMNGDFNWTEFHVAQGSGSSARWRSDYGLAVFDASGRHLEQTVCALGTTCTPFAGALGTLVLSPQGGFDYAVAGRNQPVRFFTYKPASGDVIWFGVSASSLVVGTKPRSPVAPTLGEVTRRWDVQMNWQAVANASFTDLTRTVTSVDAQARTYRQTDAVTNRVDTWTLDAPRYGLRHRTANAAGANELIAMVLPGTGVVVYNAVVADSALDRGSFGLSINKP